MNVVIGDENDNSPIMEKSEIELNLRENMAVGASLLKVYGRDADSEFGVLSFSLDNNGGNFFRIDEKSGEIFLNRQIDFETRRAHQVRYFFYCPNNRLSNSWRRYQGPNKALIQSTCKVSLHI